MFLHGCGNRLFCFILQGRYAVGRLPVAEVFLDDLDHLVRIEIAGQADGAVVRDIHEGFLPFDGGDVRILQVLLGADDGLGPVRVMGEEDGINGDHRFFRIIGQPLVVFFVDSFQLGVETADDHVLEAVGLDLGPVLDLVGRDVFLVAGYIAGREGIGPFGSDQGHHLVIFIGDGQFRGFVTDGVDPVVGGGAFGRVRLGPVNIIQGLDLVQHGLFCRVVGRSDEFGTFEHDVLKVVGETGVVGRIVLAAGTDGNVGLDTRGLLVDGHVHFQAVVQGVDLGVERIAGNRFIAVAGGGEQGSGRDGEQKDSLHVTSNLDSKLEKNP